MDPGYLKISHVPFKVFYDSDAIKSDKKLPSEQRNINIIWGIKFGELLQHINAKNEEKIVSWLNNHKKKLEGYLQTKKNKLKRKDDKYCKNLNYILDFVLQAVKNYSDSTEFFRLRHDFDKNSRDVLNSYNSLKCSRDLHNSDDENLYIKKIMYDLLDDIEYMLSVKHIRNRTQCFNMINRIIYRWRILWNIYYAVRNTKFFDFDKNCTLSIIGEKLKALNCNTTTKPLKTVTAAEPQPLNEPKSINEVPASQGDSSESRGTKDAGDAIDIENPESVDIFPEDLKFSLPVNEDPPKLDTTYAAASLAGISLFGTILYKYGPFRNRLNSLRGAMNGSNIFPLDNNIYDANRMNNFEYLQTGIPNDEYQVGYGSVTDY